MCQILNSSWKIAVQMLIFIYFFGGHKNDFRLGFRSSFYIIKFIQTTWIELDSYEKLYLGTCQT